MPAAEIDLLLEVIDQAFDRQSWHGPNLRGALRGVSCEQALWRPQPDRHCIWEQALHAAYWKYTVRRRLLNEKRGSFPRNGSNWIEPEDQTAAAWRRDLKLLVDIHQSMRSAISQLKPNKLRQPMPNSKLTYFELVSGIAAHDIYHAGQVQLLKRLQSA